MSWHFVERWLQKVNQHSTLIGKFWITFLIVFRIVVVSSVGDRVYSDEQSEFKCNTMQVGCPNVCFNQFSPISHIRFWSFQILMVTTPSIVFMVYSAHQIKKKPSKEKTSSSGPTPSPTKKAEMQANEGQGDEDERRRRKSVRSARPTSLMPGQELQTRAEAALDAQKIRQSVMQEMFGDEKSAFTQHYVLYSASVLMRTLAEVLFILLQYKLFGFRISELYQCTGYPCPHVIDCFVSRPMEKTIFLWFMFVIAVICLSLNVAEMYYLIWQFGVRRARLERRRHRQRRQTLSEARGVTLADAEILDGGILSANHPPPPDYRGLASMEEHEAMALVPTGTTAAGKTGMAMSFSLDDAILPEHGGAGAARYPNYSGPNHQAGSAGGSSRSNNFVAPVEVTLVDQPYLATNAARGTDKPKANDYYDYV